MAIEIRALPAERLADALHPIVTAFGFPLPPERMELIRAIPELDLRLGAFDGDTIVGAASNYGFEMTVPGGASIPCAGLTLVGVLATHRRRGVLRSLMRRYLDEAHRRAVPISALYASEAPIYGRFGYGLASLHAHVELHRHRNAFLDPPAFPARARLLGEPEATTAFAEIYERVRLSTPGMIARSAAWWRARRTGDPEWARMGRPPLHRVLVEIDGRPAAYAMYRLSESLIDHDRAPALEISEALGDSPEATRAVWRYLLDVDVADRVTATLSVDHPLQLLLTDPRALGTHLADGLWVRLVDVGRALAARRYGAAGAAVIEVEDAFCAWNNGRYRLHGGTVEPTAEAPDVVVDADALGAVYLGGFTFAQLWQAGRAVERRPGGVHRADALFRTERAPWCPERF
jgi:predicted acetyltransferase